MAEEIVGARLYAFSASGSMGVVTDTIYRRCFWPRLTKPCAIFAEGSSGIQVEGPPTPRNVVFPDDTVFIGNTKGDCFFFRDDKDIVEISVAETRQLVEGSRTEQQLRAGKTVFDLNTGAAKR